MKPRDGKKMAPLFFLAIILIGFLSLGIRAVPVRAEPEPTHFKIHPDPTARPTKVPEDTATPQVKDTETPLPSATLAPTGTPLSTGTPLPTSTTKPTDTPVNTDAPSSTPTSATDTDTPVPTDTLAPTDTPVSTDTSTPRPTQTSANTPTESKTEQGPTDTPSATITPGATITPSATATPGQIDQTATPSQTSSSTAVATNTSTAVPSSVPSETAVSTTTPEKTDVPAPSSTPEAGRTPVGVEMTQTVRLNSEGFEPSGLSRIVGVMRFPSLHQRIAIGLGWVRSDGFHHALNVAGQVSPNDVGIHQRYLSELAKLKVGDIVWWDADKYEVRYVITVRGKNPVIMEGLLARWATITTCTPDWADNLVFLLRPVDRRRR